MRKYFPLVLILSLVVCVAAQAQETNSNAPNPKNPEVTEAIVTDRPDFTESTETVPSGMTQIEGGVTFARAGAQRSNSFGEILIRHATGRKAELRVELPTRAQNRGAGGRESGFEDGSLGFKVMLSPGSGELGLKQPRVSLIGATSLPLGSRSFREKRLQPEAKLCLGWDLSERVALSSNLNAAYLSEGGDRFTEVSGSVSLGFGLSEKLGSYVEVYSFEPSGDRASSRYINGGLTYQINPDFQLDARVGFGLSNDVDGRDNFLGFGVARRF